MSDSAARWIVVPVAEQAGGGWVDEVLRQRLREAPMPGLADPAAPVPRQRIEVVRGPDAEAEVNERFRRRGWTDGLPVVAPTIARVRAAVEHGVWPPMHVLGEMEPLRGLASVERIAANAVMAGCAPIHFPIVLAAVEALLEPRFNLRGVQTTDENVTPLLIISGPIAGQVGLNGGIGALGPGWRANACIGRALRLVMSNIGGGWPGVVSMAGVGQPGRYTLCLAEHPTASPWPGLAAEAGLPTGSSAVTAIRAESAINVTGELEDVASVMSTMAAGFSVLHGGRVAVLIAPHVARTAAARGMTRAGVARWLHDHARLDSEVWRRSWIARQVGATYGLPDWVEQALPSGWIPIVERPQDILVFVAGADVPIPQNVFFPAWGFPPASPTVGIRLPDDWETLCAQAQAAMP